MRDVNLLGALGDFGVGLSPTLGATLAAGAGTGVAVATRLLTAPGSKAYAWSEGIGLFAGLLAGGAMYALPGTREAGKIGIAVAAVTQGLRVLEQLFAGSAPVGWAMQEGPNPALGMPSAQQIAGLGYAMATNQPHAYGTVPGVAGAVAGPQMDNGQPPAGGMSMSRLYGATVF